jgi:hypothetical protein
MPHPTQHSTIGPPWPAAKTLDYGRTAQRRRISGLLSQAAEQKPAHPQALSLKPQSSPRAQ